MLLPRARARSFLAHSALLLLVSTPGIAMSESPASPEPTVWRLASRSAAIYERQHELVFEPGANRHWGPFVREMNPPLLFGDELDGSRSALQLPISDTRDLGRHLAFDLAAYGNERVRRGEIELQNSLLPLAYELRFEAPDAMGQQRAKGRLKPLRGSRAEGSEGQRYLTGNQGLLEGDLVLSRRFDRERGLVVAFDFSMELRWTPRSREKAEGTFDLHWREIWSLREVLSADLPADRSRLDELVRESTTRATVWMEQKLGPPTDPSMWPTPERATSAANFPDGANASLTLLALLHAGRDRSEPLLAQAFERVLAVEPRDLWAHATRVLAIAGAAAPREERSGLRIARNPSPRRVPAEMLPFLEASVRQLLAPLARADAAQPLLWLGTDGRSCSERAHLATRALAEAAWCGIDLPASTWPRLAAHWLAARNDSGFTCETHHHEATGGATAMALDSLQLCRRFLLDDPASQQDARLLRAIDQGLRSGWHWMEEHYVTRRQPGPLFAARAQIYHYHWALLSAAKGGAREELGGRPIVWETLLHYVGAQSKYGSWANHDDNAFALLCLDAPPRAPETPASGR
ncbi:MAG: hypothetical protein JNM84_08485 [Planctomycetes bacterium]|nr:hypothetical protein [Planctomycetota bacterium]